MKLLLRVLTAVSMLAAASGNTAPAKAPTPAGSAAPTSRLQPSRIVDALPDSALLARVDDRIIRVFDFRERYFEADPTFRPRADSAGRADFLNTLIDRHVMSFTALKINHPLNFEDRLRLTPHINAVLQNVLYKRLVTDSLHIKEADLETVMKQFGYDQHLQSILFRERSLAERVRGDLARGTIPWTSAVERYSMTKGNPQGDMGWVERTNARGELAIKTFDLNPGAVSDVILDPEGYRVFRSVERRPARSTIPASFSRTVALEDLKALKRGPYVRKFNESIRRFAGVVYDTANIEWAADRFKQAYAAKPPSPAGTLDMTEIMPEFGPADTGRVLARTKTRSISVGDFVYGYSTIPVLYRDKISSLEPFINSFDGPAFEAERVQMALALGFDQDPEARRIIDERREGILVEHLYQDSVINKVLVTPDMRRQYYKQREKEFVSFPRVRYARFLRPNEASTRSLMARLQGGEAAHRILQADSLMGDDSTGTIEEVLKPNAGEYTKLLFEELHPGQVTTVGPDKNGQYFVFQSLAYDPERQLAYTEVQGIIDESLQNLESERILHEFLARRRRAYRIESHPEMVMRFELDDPVRDSLKRKLD